MILFLFPGDSYQGFGGMDGGAGGGGGQFGEQSGGPDGSANGGSANQGGMSVPDFLPPAQRVLFMRIQQKQQEEARRLAEGGTEKRPRDTEGIDQFSSCLFFLVFFFFLFF